MIDPKVYELDFEIKGDDRGSLIALENSKNIPFDIKRVYYIFGTKDEVVRGHHAHKNLKQVLICVSGSVDIKCEYKDKSEIYRLCSPNKALAIEGLVWREMFNFSKDAVLVVLADALYDEKDYIRDHNSFLYIARNK